jgi:hypothetical protein
MSSQAQIGDTVRIHFICKSEDGTILDFSLGREPFQWTIGKSQAMKDIEQAVIGMSPDDFKSVTIPADRTFGPLAGKNLIFDILLLRIANSQQTNDGGYHNLINALQGKGTLDEIITRYHNSRHLSILISVPVYNRPKITRLSLAQTKRYKTSSCQVQVFNDHSSEYDNAFLTPYADEVIKLPEKMGIHNLRLYQFRKFLETDFDCIYMTDNDVIHDPRYITALKALYEMGERLLPVCMYNTRFHMHPSCILYHGNGIFLKKTAPGVSLLFDRKMIEKIVSILENVGHSHDDFGWDYRAIAYLDSPCITSETSYLEHYGGDGIHNNDFERDKALYPTRYLQDRRESILNYLTQDTELEVNF